MNKSDEEEEKGKDGEEIKKIKVKKSAIVLGMKYFRQAQAAFY